MTAETAMKSPEVSVGADGGSQIHASRLSALRLLVLSHLLVMFLAVGVVGAQDKPARAAYEFNDSHFHLTNYIQNGINIHGLVKIMGDRVRRVALFGIPLQQQWSYRISGDFAPTYYLESDAPLYYYSFTDAFIAMEYRSLTPEQQNRFDPMITGFNPADMYAADHIRRVLTTFPGVFSGIGEFTIHKEFVSSKVAGEIASLADPALDRVFEFAGEVGLVVIIHNDINVPFPRDGTDPIYLKQLKDLFTRHPGTTTIWAHAGMGRVVQPIKDHAAMLERALGSPLLSHVHIDISWDEVAKYLVGSPEATRIASDLINRYPDRFLFGTDEVAPPDQQKYLRVYEQYAPLWKLLSGEASEKIRKGNYERLFDDARRKIRAWERAHAN
jgi:hypothetical protein